MNFLIYTFALLFLSSVAFAGFFDHLADHMFFGHHHHDHHGFYGGGYYPMGGYGNYYGGGYYPMGGYGNYYPMYQQPFYYGKK